MKLKLTHVDKQDIVNNTFKIPENIIAIETDAFYRLGELKTIIIPKDVTKINLAAFNACKNLETVVFESPLFVIDPKAFYQCENLKKIYLPSCSNPDYIIHSTKRLRDLENSKHFEIELYDKKPQKQKTDDGRKKI